MQCGEAMKPWHPTRLTPTQLEERRRAAARLLRAGRPPRLTAARWRVLARVLTRGARAAGFDTERWTLRRIAVVVKRALGVRYHVRSLGRVLRAHGWSPQRPPTQARERDTALVEAWLTRDWPRIKKGARRARRVMAFLDETGHTFRARVGTTWAPVGRPPVLRRVSTRREVYWSRSPPRVMARSPSSTPGTSSARCTPLR